MFLLFFYAAMAIAISFICSVSEASLLSITPSYIAQLEEKNPRWYKRVSKLKRNMDTPLAAILTLNTIANTVGAAGIGAQVTKLYGSAYLGIASGIMTVAILVLSEIMPKTIGSKYWRSLIPAVCTIVETMVFVLRPVLYISNFIMGLFGKSEYSDVKDEIKALAKIGRDQNLLDDTKFRIINNIIKLQEVSVGDVMTPRTVVHKVKPEMTIGEFDCFLCKTPFSRFPIIDEQEKIFSGYIHKSSSYKAHNDSDKVEQYARPMRSFSDEAHLEDVLNSMLEDHNHMALVIDAFGNWVGIITLEDIIETILGKEILDETDQVADMRLYAKLKWKNKRAQKGL
ncbi:MAG: DUF21 domain-containing protein [Alphaproteobacteria bacterium]|nr:DUF21 domain-containing protein [Alphaproteobacteria bacterium]